MAIVVLKIQLQRLPATLEDATRFLATLVHEAEQPSRAARIAEAPCARLRVRSSSRRSRQIRATFAYSARRAINGAAGQRAEVGCRRRRRLCGLLIFLESDISRRLSIELRALSRAWTAPGAEITKRTQEPGKPSALGVAVTFHEHPAVHQGLRSPAEGGAARQAGHDRDVVMVVLAPACAPVHRARLKERGIPNWRVEPDRRT
jgi:hypothetical protein